MSVDEIDEKEFAWLQELLADTASRDCGLTDWESEFLDDMRARVVRWGSGVFISDKQMTALRRIEAKVHDA
jgi:hypothetical protein